MSLLAILKLHTCLISVAQIIFLLDGSAVAWTVLLSNVPLKGLSQSLLSLPFPVIHLLNV